MKSAQHITIANPCHEDWDEMMPVQQGRYCGACRKVVVDFTQMTDGQILDVIKKAGGHIPCGRYRASQLDREFIDTRHKTTLISLISGKAAALLMLIQSVSGIAKAQEEKKDSIEQRKEEGNKQLPVKEIKRGSIKLDYSISLTTPEVIQKVREVTIYPDIALMGFAISGRKNPPPLFQMPSLKPSLLPKTTSTWKRLTNYWAGKETKAAK